MNALDSRYFGNVVVLSHWTVPNKGRVHNCHQDWDACEYMHKRLPSGIKFLEFGDSGQDGLVNRCMNDNTRFRVYDALTSRYNAQVKKGG